MLHVHEGQCGLCVHFGETHVPTPQIIQMRSTMEAPESLIDDCGHPQHADLNLKVTPISGCSGFESAPHH